MPITLEADTNHELRVEDFDAAVFDLDGVVTRTARVHAETWKQLFDRYLQDRAAETGEPFRPFDIATDYPRYVDGKPRYDGVASFLASRGIDLPRGDPSDPPEAATVCGLGNRKNAIFRDVLARDGVAVFDHTVRFIRALRDHDVRTALASSSRNARAVLDTAGLTDLFDAVIDGNDLARLDLPGKPAPDLFLEAARALGIDAQHAIVLEDALSGVEAGRAGGFGLVIGVDRAGQADALKQHGADVVISDLAELHIRDRPAASRAAGHALPRALERYEEIAQRLAGKRAAVFLDYDGTLTPIVARPDLAILSEDMRAAVRALASVCTVAIVSGRDRADVARLVGLDGLIYAGSHGFDISGPEGMRIQHEEGAAFIDVVGRAADRLGERLAAVEGALVEPKRFAVAVHYRQVAEPDIARVERAVDDVLDEYPTLRKTFGKKVFELRPRLDWDKGRAVLWLLEALDLDRPDVVPFYFGDDTTDEDAFAVLAERGVGVFVGDPTGDSAARYVLDGPEDVHHFLRKLAATLDLRND